MPFKPGETGNPNGRPRNGQAVTPYIRELMGMSEKELRAYRPRTTAALLAQKKLIRALEDEDHGDRLFEKLTDRVDGPVKQSVELSGGNFSINVDPGVKDA